MSAESKKQCWVDAAILVGAYSLACNTQTNKDLPPPFPHAVLLPCDLLLLHDILPSPETGSRNVGKYEKTGRF